jgi:hypothetical protein
MKRLRSWDSLFMGVMGFGLFLFVGLSFALIGPRPSKAEHPMMTATQTAPATSAPATTAPPGDVASSRTRATAHGGGRSESNRSSTLTGVCRDAERGPANCSG